MISRKRVYLVLSFRNNYQKQKSNSLNYIESIYIYNIALSFWYVFFSLSQLSNSHFIYFLFLTSRFILCCHIDALYLHYLFIFVICMLIIAFGIVLYKSYIMFLIFSPVSSRCNITLQFFHWFCKRNLV